MACLLLALVVFVFARLIVCLFPAVSSSVLLIFAYRSATLQSEASSRPSPPNSSPSPALLLPCSVPNPSVSLNKWNRWWVCPPQSSAASLLFRSSSTLIAIRCWTARSCGGRRGCPFLRTMAFCARFRRVVAAQVITSRAAYATRL